MEKRKILEYLRKKDTQELFKISSSVCKEFAGNKVFIRGIIEFSNFCCRDCLYCGLRRSNKNLKRYRMKESEIIDLALKIADLGIKTVVLQSGDDFYYTRKSICRIIKRIKKKKDIAITLSIGERPFEDYLAFREAGADRYLLKHETINPKLYEFLHPHQSLKQRIKILEYLRKIGFQIGAGMIVGLPYQTLEDLADDILFLKELDPDMAGIGPFIPQKDTPLGKFRKGDLILTLKVLSLVRILTKNTHLPATTGLGSLGFQEAQILGLRIACNVIMPNFTPLQYRKDYKIYDNKIEVSLEKAQRIILKAGKEVSFERGDSLKENFKEKKVLVK